MCAVPMHFTGPEGLIQSFAQLMEQFLVLLIVLRCACAPVFFLLLGESPQAIAFPLEPDHVGRLQKAVNGSTKASGIAADDLDPVKDRLCRNLFLIQLQFAVQLGMTNAIQKDR